MTALCESCEQRPATELVYAAGERFAVCADCAPTAEQVAS